MPVPVETSKAPAPKAAGGKTGAAKSRRPPPPAPSAAASEPRTHPPAPSLEQAEARIATLERKLSELNWEMEVHGADYRETAPARGRVSAKAEKGAGRRLGRD